MGFVHGTKWPSGVIPYEFHSSLSATAVEVAERALIDWMSKTSLSFVPRTTEPDYIRFNLQTGGRCKSGVGKVGGRQDIPCDYPPDWWSKPAHEIGHAVGLIHEHQRPDRDEHIVCSDTLPNGSKDPDLEILSHGEPIGDYDCVSLMHYDTTDSNISSKPGGCTTWGSRKGLSAGDVETIEQWYGNGVLLTSHLPRRAVAIASDENVLVFHLFGRGQNRAAWHKARGWDVNTGWKNLGGVFTSQLAAISFAPGRLAVFGVGQDGAMYWKASNEGVFESSWHRLGGVFHPSLTSPPAVASWGPNRFDLFGIGMAGGMFHKAYENGNWYPKGTEWQSLGGKFMSPPAVVSWGPKRLDILGIGMDKGMWHKSWADGWSPSETAWKPLGGKFTSLPAVCSWEPGRLDVFGRGLTKKMHHKVYKEGKGWWPSSQWEPLGGTFNSPPAVCSFEQGRIDVFGLGTDDSMCHRAYVSGWGWTSSWKNLKGTFTTRPGAFALRTWKALFVAGLGMDGALYRQSGDSLSTNWDREGGVFI